MPVPGPTLVLERDEPVEITLVNRLPEATAIHWHGMELESYYDGVHGWSGAGVRVTPMIEPGESFVVRFTPPRAGTFIYHTHLHDRRQLTIRAVRRDDRRRAGRDVRRGTDHVLVIGRGGPRAGRADGRDQRRARSADRVAAGMRHRVRLINITPDDIVSVVAAVERGMRPDLAAADEGRRAGAGGAPHPCRRGRSSASGETYDFEVEAPAGRRTLWLEVRSPAGKWHAQGHIIIK